MNQMTYQVAIDGPAAAGKSTIAKIIAKNFDYLYVDTGAMYRAVTLAALNAGIDPEDSQGITNLLSDLTIDFKLTADGQRVLLNGEDVSEKIRQPEIVRAVSAVSAIPAVREFLVNQQRALAAGENIVMDGRDIGTTVLPDANLKIFLVASVDERADRRYKESQTKGISTPLEDLKEEIRLRDYKDSHRAISPLTQAPDAHLVDTTGLTIDQVVDQISNLINE